ncbi:hypothetical protein SAMN02910398_01803 [Butyrivibrio sp. YAB3001]|nr:hypothetical protein SAMN02910398_01803 [Butyrivibrio sp. YAB3001]
MSVYPYESKRKSNMIVPSTTNDNALDLNFSEHIVELIYNSCASYGTEAYIKLIGMVRFRITI